MDRNSRPSGTSHRSSLHRNGDDNDNDNEDSPLSAARNTGPLLHPLQVEHQQQPWLIPHPSLPLSWRDNDRPQFYTRNAPHTFTNDHSAESSIVAANSNSLQRLPLSSRPTLADTKSDSSPRRETHGDIGASSHMEVDQGHESDPSELLRAPVLYSSSPPRNLVNQDMYPIRRANRSLSLSIPSNPWNNERALPPPAPSWNHREVVPYSQEWRVILRSPPRGRTVLYNPQMQSLVVQTTVGLDPPMSLRNDSTVCALCRRPLDLDTNTGEEDVATGAPGYMDTNYFQMLADANIAISRRASLQDEPSSQYHAESSFGSPTSSSRASIDLDAPLAPQSGNSGNMQDSTNSSHLSHDALNQGYYERFFVETKKLGKGFRGSVFLCQHILDGIHLGEYAIKKVAVGDNHDWLVQMLREVHLLERLHHPNIVSYKHAWLENHQLHQFSPEVTCLFILMECANGGNLEEYIERATPDLLPADSTTTAAGSSQEHEPPKPLSARERLLSEREERRQRRKASIPELGKHTEADSSKAPQHPPHYLSNTEIWSFFFDICEGLAHLHHLGIIHRDLKPPNLLLSYSNSKVKGSQGERPRVLITDFGECEIIDQSAKRDRTGATGTLEFLAPELLAVDEQGRYTNEFSFKGDMWSLGMVLYYLCYSRLPYSQIEDVDILREEIRGFKTITLPPDDERVIPEELKILIRVLLSTDKSKRPSCDDILSTLSHQRDRMMHGDMDSPTTPIVSSSSSSHATARQVGEQMETENDILVDESSETPRSQHLHSVPHRLTTLGRRRSRVALVTEPSSGTVRQGHSPETTRGTTASPSINLHKKVKPLGLGLRHMLRRKMMHFPSTGVYRSPKTASSIDNVGSMSLSVRGSPSSTSPDIIASPGITLFNEHLLQRQENVRERQRSARARESGLGLAMHLPVSQEPPRELPGHLDKSKGRGGRPVSHRGPILSSKSVPRSHSNSHSTGREKHARDTRNGVHRERPSSASSDSGDSGLDSVTKPRSRPPSRGAKSNPDTSVNRLYKNQNQSYWSHLASNHHHRNIDPQEKTNNSNGISQTAVGTISVCDPSSAPHAAADDDTSTGVAGARTIPAELVADIDVASSPDLTVIRSTRRRTHRRHSTQGTEKSLTTLHSIQRSSPSHSFSSSPSTSLDDFRVHFMFTSLLVRIWFCLRICHPVVVRPLVLYPVLVLTVVWDRYLLSLWNSSGGDPLSCWPPQSQPRRSADRQTRRQILEVQDDKERDVAEGVEGSSISQLPDQMTINGEDTHDSNTSDRPLRLSSGAGTSLGSVNVSDDNGPGPGFESGSRGSMVTFMWQAGLLGVLVQLLWIGAIWALSRDGICVI